MRRQVGRAEHGGDDGGAVVRAALGTGVAPQQFEHRPAERGQAGGGEQVRVAAGAGEQLADPARAVGEGRPRAASAVGLGRAQVGAGREGVEERGGDRVRRGGGVAEGLAGTVAAVQAQPAAVPEQVLGAVGGGGQHGLVLRQPVARPVGADGQGQARGPAAGGRGTALRTGVPGGAGESGHGGQAVGGALDADRYAARGAVQRGGADLVEHQLVAGHQAGAGLVEDGVQFAVQEEVAGAALLDHHQCAGFAPAGGAAGYDQAVQGHDHGDEHRDDEPEDAAPGGAPGRGVDRVGLAAEHAGGEPAHHEQVGLHLVALRLHLGCLLKDAARAVRLSRRWPEVRGRRR